mmetsp:Transcript_14439/g.60241  ORF Transcript_14439/g.60241 Transcript_14439/m.60241 type:complete len:570 (-) Transcript_14439:165-1874(-)
MSSSLDHHATVRGCRQRADGHHGRRKHQGARARHHQQCAGHVRVLCALRPKHGRDHGDEQSSEAHDRHVVLGEHFHGTFRLGPARLRLIHEAGEAVHGRVLRPGCGGHLNERSDIHRAGEHLRATALFDGLRLSSQCRLIHGGGAGGHFSVNGNFGAREHGKHHPHLDVLCLDHLARAGEGCLLGGELKHCLDGIARLADGQRLEPLRKAEERNDSATFGVLANYHCACHRDRHERVDVEHLVANAADGLLQDPRDANDRSCNPEVLEPLHGAHVAKDGNEGEHAGQEHIPGRNVALSRGLGAPPPLLDVGLQGRRVEGVYYVRCTHQPRRVRHKSRLRRHRHGNLGHAFHGVEDILDQRDLRRAADAVDEDAKPRRIVRRRMAVLTAVRALVAAPVTTVRARTRARMLPIPAPLRHRVRELGVLFARPPIQLHDSGEVHVVVGADMVQPVSIEVVVAPAVGDKHSVRAQRRCGGRRRVWHVVQSLSDLVAEAALLECAIRALAAHERPVRHVRGPAAVLNLHRVRARRLVAQWRVRAAAFARSPCLLSRHPWPPRPPLLSISTPTHWA